MWNKGSVIHQFTQGSGGKHLDDVCHNNIKDSTGNFLYAQSKYNGFSLVHVTPEEFNVKNKGVYQPEAGGDVQVFDIFEVSISRNADGEETD